MMIESVQVRQRGAYDFDTHYENLCALQSSCPVPAIKAHLAQRTLDVNGDRIRVNDWAPILNSIRINKSLEYIAVRSHFISFDDTEEEKKSYQARRKTPAIRSREMSVRLCKSLKDCMVQSPSLTTLELVGIPLRNRDLQLLAKGIQKSRSLKNLSLELCNIGDDGLEVISRSLKNATRLSTLNLSACGLTADGASTIAKIVKNQAIRCHNEAWRESLRYRRPDLESMPGIRRITLNQNPLISDRGALFLAEVLKDDLWLKALDLQNCCVTDTGAQTFLKVLQFNSTIVLLDLRQNLLIDRNLLRSIMEQALINSEGLETEYKWLETSTGHSPSPKKRRPRTISYRRPTNRTQNTSRKRSKSAGSVLIKPAVIPQTTKPGPWFVPWRTAQRALKYRDEAAGNEDEDQSEAVFMSRDSSPDTRARSKDRKEHKNDLRQAKSLLMEEKEKRLKTDKRLLELTSENTRLKHRLHLIQRDGGATILDDDQLLDHIETSFAKFDAFLDMLRQAGLGKLVAMAGLDDYNPLKPSLHEQNQSYCITSTPTKSLYGHSAPHRSESLTNRMTVDRHYDLAIGRETADEYKPATADELYQRIKQQALLSLQTKRQDVNQLRHEFDDVIENQGEDRGSRDVDRLSDNDDVRVLDCDVRELSCDVINEERSRSLLDESAHSGQVDNLDVDVPDMTAD